MNCPIFRSYSVQRCIFNQVHFQNYGGGQRRRGLEAWNGFHRDRHRLCSFLRGCLRCLLYRLAFLKSTLCNVILTNFTIIAVFVLMAQSSTMQVGSYEINVILTNFTMMLLPPLSTIYWFAVSSKLIIFTTVTFIKVVMFDCSMHCIQ